jgi:16S rRNA G1207 methylase RsmC
MNEMMERRVHGGGAMAVAREGESMAWRLTLARVTLLDGARRGVELSKAERERNRVEVASELCDGANGAVMSRFALL